MGEIILRQFFGFCVVFAVGGMGFLAFRRLKLPNPGLLGSMFFTGILNIAGFFPAFPGRVVAFISNAMIGIMLGRQIDRRVVSRIRDVAKFVLLQVGAMLGLSLLSGFVFYKMTELPLATAMLAGTAGGISEMTAFAISINANAVVIAFVQICRIIVFLALIPYFVAMAEKFSFRETDAPQKTNSKDLQEKIFFARRDYCLMIPAAILGAWIANRLHIPTGPMLGAMIVCGLFAFSLDKTYRYDIRIRFAAQIGLGSIMGQRMGPDIVTLLGHLFLPAMVATLVMVTGCLLLAFLLHKMSGWDMITCLLCSAPAGLSQITVYAEEIGADSFTASVFHTVRILSIVGIYPWIIMPML